MFVVSTVQSVSIHGSKNVHTSHTWNNLFFQSKGYVSNNLGLEIFIRKIEPSKGWGLEIFARKIEPSKGWGFPSIYYYY
jgi:hypothetical protein